ncbi:MAG: VWA domain-containing protein [Methylococcaceae bacterium]
MNEFHFIRPYYLLTLLPYILLVYYAWRHKLSRSVWSEVCDAALLPYLLQDKASAPQRLGLITLAIAALLSIIALAGPTWQRLPVPVFRNTSALVIALDLSRSMDAQDIKPSRLARARYKISDILRQRKDGQTALLVYAGAAFTVTPLTDDVATIDSQLSALTTDIMPAQGNNTAQVLSKAVDLFKQAGLRTGQILLVTDGAEDTVDTQGVLQGNYKLSVLAVGTEDGAPIAAPEGGFLKDDNGTIIIPKLNKTALAALAQAGQGIYQTISDDDSDVQTLLATISALPNRNANNEDSHLSLEQWEEQGAWLLLLVLPLAALSFRKGLLTVALVLLLPLPKNSYAFGWQDLWQTKDQQAQQAFQAKNYAQAAQQFSNPAWQAVAAYKAGDYDKALEALKTAPNAYNQGNALAKKGQLQEALAAYNQALAQNPHDEDAQFNKELVEKELEKQKQEQKQDKNGQGDQQDKSDKPQDPQKSEQQQQGDEGKPEQKSEQNPQDQQANKQQQDKQNQEQKQAEPQQAKQAEPKDKNDKEDKKAPTPQEMQQSTEQQQANEQWLKRIPDDPAGLLRRKFKYQYGQQGGER